jgi:arginyl-tRNA--protein-N-Asp/Glu arginylyltransferase
MSLQKTKLNTFKSIAVDRHHNSTDNRLVAIGRLDLLINVLQSFFSFWAAGLSTFVVGTHQEEE